MSSNINKNVICLQIRTQLLKELVYHVSGIKKKKIPYNRLKSTFFLFGGIISEPCNIFHILFKYNTHHEAFFLFKASKLILARMKNIHLESCILICTCMYFHIIMLYNTVCVTLWLRITYTWHIIVSTCIYILDG